ATVAVDAAGELFACGDAQGTLTVRRTSDGSVLRSIPGPGARAWFLKFASGRKHLAAQYEGQSGLRIWSLAPGGTDRTFPVNGGMGFSPDGNWAAVADPGGAIVCRNLATGAEQKRLTSGPGRHLCAIDPQGMRLAVTSQQDGLQLDLIDVRSRAVTGSV